MRSSSPTPATSPSASPRSRPRLRGLTNVVVTRRDARQRDALGHVRRPCAGCADGAHQHALDPARRARQHHDQRPRRRRELARRRVPARAVQGRRTRARRRRAARRRQRRGHALVAPGGHRARHRLPAGRRIVRGDPGQGARPRQSPGAARHRCRARTGCARSPTCARSPPGTPGCRSSREAQGQPFTARTDGPGLPGDEQRARAGLRPAHDHRGTGRIDPAVQRPARHVPGRGDHAAGRRGAPLPDPCAQRERGLRPRSNAWRSPRRCS